MLENLILFEVLLSVSRLREPHFWEVNSELSYNIDKGLSCNIDKVLTCIEWPLNNYSEGSFKGLTIIYTQISPIAEPRRKVLKLDVIVAPALIRAPGNLIREDGNHFGGIISA